MTADQKQKIYDLLKKSSALVNNGFVSDSFMNTVEFCDDALPADENSDFAVSNNADNENILQNNEENNTIEVKKETAFAVSNHTITDISAKISRCTRCGLARTRNNVVPGQGVEHPEVLVIGEGPGYDEDMQGLPFVGKAGVLLDKMLSAINLDRKTNCYIANIVKCRPPQNRDPLPEEQDACISFLEAQIHILKPKMILCMGRISGHKISDTDLPMRELHGNFYDYHGIPAMITYHPSALLRDESLKRPAWDDLKRFRQKLNELQAK